MTSALTRRAAVKQRVLDDDAGHRVGGVGELVRGADVARGKDAAVRRPQPIVDHDAALARPDAGGLEIQPLRVWRAADGDQDRVRLDTFACRAPR